jgi:glucarate dehydratase
MNGDRLMNEQEGPKVRRVEVTPVAFADPPLLNKLGVHEPYAIRTIVEVVAEDGIIGLGETYGDAAHLTMVQRLAERVIGMDIFATTRLWEVSSGLLRGTSRQDQHGLTGKATPIGTVDRVTSAFEVAFLDAQGRALGRSVSDLLGGSVRSEVPYSAYLFYKWAGHPDAEPDRFGAALDPDGIVAQARWLVEEYGFTAIKLKGGVFGIDEEVEAIEALHDAFPDHPLRLDPNAAWSVQESIDVGRRTDGLLEYLEDPTAGIPGMAQVAREVPMPLATNMCVVSFDQLPQAIDERPVGVILSDHHVWGGLQRSRLLAGICDTFGIGLSMHSNSHLGISLAAMTQLASVTPNLTYACDTHWPWKDSRDDVVEPGAFSFHGGSLAVPTGPGLGVDLDRDALARLHEQYQRCGIRTRDDGGYLSSLAADFEPESRSRMLINRP